MSDIEILSKNFHANMTNFCDEMVSTYKKPAFVVTRVVLPGISSKFIFGRINNVLPTLKKIHETRDVTLYNEIEGKFGEMDMAINATIELLEEGNIDEENTNAIWAWVGSFILYTEKYNELIALHNP